MPANGFQKVIGAVYLFDLMLGIDRAHVERIAASCRTQDGAGGTGKVPDGFTRQLDQTTAGIAFRKQKPFKAIADANNLPAEFARRQYRAGDDGVEPGDVAATDIYGNAFRFASVMMRLVRGAGF